MASGTYDVWRTEIMKKSVDMVNDTVKCALYNNSFSFATDQAAYATTNELATAGGYTQGGATLANKAVTTASNKGKFDADDVSWTSATFSAYFALLYDDTTATKYPIACIDFGGVQTVTGGTFTIQWSANGILTIS
jgi:hypothetical protein